MTPDAALARLGEIAEEQRRLADEQRHLLDALTGDAPTPQADRWLSTKEVMALARVDSPSTPYRWAKEFRLPEKRIRGRRYFAERAVLALLAGARGENGEAAAKEPAIRGETHPRG